MTENEKDRITVRLEQIQDLNNGIYLILRDANCTETNCAMAISNCITDVIEKMNEEVEKVTEKE